MEAGWVRLSAVVKPLAAVTFSTTPGSWIIRPCFTDDLPGIAELKAAGLLDPAVLLQEADSAPADDADPEEDDASVALAGPMRTGLSPPSLGLAAPDCASHRHV
jgi:hypothetical protein